MKRPSSTTRRRATSVLAAAGLLLMTGCGVQPDSQPTPIRDIDFVGSPSQLATTGVDRVYFVGPGEERLLRSVARDAVSLKNLIEILFSGPIDAELQQSYYSAIPVDTEVLSVQPIGSVLRIDVSDAITSITGPELTRALAQIVFTATDFEGIEAVQVRVDGETVEWPTGTGDTAVELRIYDFPDAVENSQPDYPALPVAGQ